MKRREKREYPIKLIKFNDFDHEIDSTSRPVLMLCIRRDYQFGSQTDLIRDVLGRAAEGCPIDLKVCLVDDESNFALRDKLDIQASPHSCSSTKARKRTACWGSRTRSGSGASSIAPWAGNSNEREETQTCRALTTS